MRIHHACELTIASLMVLSANILFTAGSMAAEPSERAILNDRAMGPESMFDTLPKFGVKEANSAVITKGQIKGKATINADNSGAPGNFSLIQTEVLRGRLVFGHEARGFQPCGDTRTVWVSARGDVLKRLRAGYSELAQTPYAPVYAEIEVVELDEPPGAFTAEYDGVIEVRAVRNLARDAPPDCAPAVDRSVVGDPVPAQPRTYVFVCDDGQAVTVRVGHDDAWVFLRDGTRRLDAATVGGVARWADGEIMLEIDDQVATFSRGSGSSRKCRNDPRRAVWEHAKLGGADFRAVGNEPGWHLEIREQSRLVLVADYGSVTVERPLPQPQADAEANLTRWNAGDLVVEVSGVLCTDTMSGEIFESTITVYWDDHTLRGCGRALH